ncbi:nucleotidyltransferase family protein [Brevibacillus sp. SYSU BS000544]|uniref:nucleotidyltransferase family protein n=1 Tax=Brevibacillus sp. SYSU BS000544 TaxID=3416443 RepID=UPI003CE521B5
MINWKNILALPSTSVFDAIQMIDSSGLQIVLVADQDGRLLGTVTDGDIRRGLLKGRQLTDPVSTVMNPYPSVATPFDSRENILALMKIKHLRQIPIVDDEGTIIRVEILDDLLQPKKKENWVVLMAGGLGTRLAPLTDDCPKPLLKVGNKPLLETIMLNFIEQGFHHFYISVNYRSDMITDYFGDGSRWGVEIRYIHESKRMGTAGALTLLPEVPQLPLIVMNGDLLTKVNFEQLLDFHTTHHAVATMCVREYDFQVPYGVVKIDKHRLLRIEEKPLVSYFVNAGIYVLNPDSIQDIPKDSFYDMPKLFEKLVDNQKNVSVFPIREYWLDIGRMSDFEKANGEFPEVFG